MVWAARTKTCLVTFRSDRVAGRHRVGPDVDHHPGQDHQDRGRQGLGHLVLVRRIRAHLDADLYKALSVWLLP